MVGVNFNNITYPFRRLFRKIKNVFRWLPTIWKDEDFDDHFIVEILIKKLEHTRDFFLSGNTHIARAEEVAEEIQEAIDRLHMTRDSWEFYEQPAHDIIEEKWGKTTFEFIPLEDRPNVSEMVSKTEKVKTPEDKEQYSEDFRAAMKTARKEYMKDKKEAYKFIAKHIDGWWD
jgi:hypothetical protein